MPSANYEIARADGYVEGGCLYANEEPHHGEGMNYTVMHHAAREQELANVIEGTGPAECTASEIWLQIRFPAVGLDADADWQIADGNGTCKYYLLRDCSGVIDDVELHQSGYFVDWCGFDVVETPGTFDTEWVASVYDAKLVR